MQLCPKCHIDKDKCECPQTSDVSEDIEETEWVFDETTDVEYLNAMCQAYTTASEINAMTGDLAAIKKRIMRKALAVIDKVVGDIYTDIISRDKEDD